MQRMFRVHYSGANYHVMRVGATGESTFFWMKKQKTVATKSPRRLRFGELPQDYAGLCQLHLPRPIHDEAALRSAWQMMEAMVGRDLTHDQQDYLAVLTDLVEAYEENTRPVRFEKSSPAEILGYLLKENGMDAAEFSRLLDIDRSIGGRILRGDRALTLAQVRKLARRFSVSPALFISG